MHKPINFVLIGRSGCGKGTQAKLLNEHFGNIYYISTGHLFRELAKQETEVGYKIKELLNGGGLPFDDLAIMLWMSEISYNLKAGQGFCLDGAPRRIEEAMAFDAFLKYLDKQDSTMVILIDISRKEAFDRLTKRRELEERADDIPEAIKNRLDYFDKDVAKVIKYFKKKKRLIKINGEQLIEKVFEDILAEIRKRND